jgi:hypothetical protein
MKLRTGLWLLGAFLLTQHGAQAQTGPIEPGKPPEIRAQKKTDKTPVTAPLSVGTPFNATLTSELDTRKARAGDPVTAEVAEDVKYERSVVFPRGTKIVGHVVRASSSIETPFGESALFVQFDNALLRDGEKVVLNAGIQALALNSVPPGNEGYVGEPEGLGTVPAGALGVTSSTDSVVLAATRDNPRLPADIPTKPVGELDSNGLFTPESQGVWGRPDLKLYTPTSDGSHGSVMLSSQKNIHLEKGTRLLLVVQPLPPAAATPN